MPHPIIDAVGVTATDMRASIGFYEVLGFAFPPLGRDDHHIEALTDPGSVRLMIDDAALAASLIGEAPRPGNGAAFALSFDCPAAVDAAATAALAGGGRVVAEPWDAFWGQRYATVADPDGYCIDLFAPL
jgi:uncharacterized glyoxalase superfamily protein PhnB